MDVYISKIRQGAGAGDAQRECELAVVPAQRMGFEFRSMDESANDVDVGELIDHLIAVEQKIGAADDNGPRVASHPDRAVRR